MFEYLVAILGLIIGVFLGKLTPEEFRSGKKYFILLSKISLFLIIAILLYFVGLNYWLLGVIFGLIIGYFFNNLYFYLGLGLFSSGNIFVAFLIFLFGLPHGTLLYHNKNWKLKLKNKIMLFFIPLVILLIPSNYLVGIVGFSAGALFIQFLRRYG